MEKAFDLATTRKMLATLPEEHRVAMGVIVCERLVPNFLRFEEATGFSGYDLLKRALDTTWERLAGKQVGSPVLEDLLINCEKLLPDSDDFATTTVSMAIDAVNAVCLMIESFDAASPKTIADICAAAVDTVDMFIQLTALGSSVIIGVNDERLILEHPLMQAELTRQRIDYDTLVRTTAIDAAFVEWAKKVCAQRGGSVSIA